MSDEQIEADYTVNHQCDWNDPRSFIACYVAPEIGSKVRLVDLDPTAGWVYAEVLGVREASSSTEAKRIYVVDVEPYWDTVVYWPTYLRVNITVGRVGA